MNHRFLAMTLCLISAPAMAQSPYVAGALGADVSRSSHVESSLYPSPSKDAEVLSGSLRVGTSIGSNWGVELEFVRSGRSDNAGPIINPLAQTGSISAAAFTVLPPGVVSPNISIPVPFDYRTDVRRRHTSIDAVAWARQPVADTVDLVYLAGIAFSRERSDVTQNIIPILRIVPPATSRSTFIEFATRPLVGAEARIGLASRMRLVPGVRVQGLGNGWLVRPSVALAWFF